MQGQYFLVAPNPSNCSGGSLADKLLSSSGKYKRFRLFTDKPCTCKHELRMQAFAFLYRPSISLFASPRISFIPSSVSLLS
jgi:hypothetical protein